MKILYSQLILGIAIFFLVTAGNFTQKVTRHIHPDPFVNSLIKNQLFIFVVGIVVTLLIIVINPESKSLLGIGQLYNLTEKEQWLGITGNKTWLIEGIQLLFFISIATGTFMFFAVKNANGLYNFNYSLIPLIVLCALTNSLSEELIFRFGIIGSLENHFPKIAILIFSAIIFGIPHFYGNPGGIIGVLMSGLLGYILCKATIETAGLSIAWVIHFVQDVIIFTALIMINVKPTIP